MGFHRLPEQHRADACALAFRPYIELIDPSLAERDEAVDIVGLYDPNLALHKHDIAHEPEVLVRRVQLRQERQARAEHKPQQTRDRLGIPLIGSFYDVQRPLPGGSRLI